MKKSILLFLLISVFMSCTKNSKTLSSAVKMQIEKNAENDDSVTENTMILVEGGSFVMGEERDLFDNPPHEVSVKSFYISNTEVTQKLFNEITKTENPHNDIELSAAAEVSWYEAVEFCNKLSERDGYTPCYAINGLDVKCNFDADGYRLPTEAEWEFAARGGLKSKNYIYSGGNDAYCAGRYIFREGELYSRGNVAVDSPNELELYDMSGGASEWCWDWYDDSYYKKSPQDNPHGPAKFHNTYHSSNHPTGRVIRGANYEKWDPDFKISHRQFLQPESKFYYCGLRVARNAGEPFKNDRKSSSQNPSHSSVLQKTIPDSESLKKRQINMVLVEGGKYSMGTWKNADSPCHEVSLDSFYIADIETPQHLFLEVMNYRNYQTEDEKGDNFPVLYVSWLEAVEFCNKLSVQDGYTPCYTINGLDVKCNFDADGYRLPTEAEWEFAARGGNLTHNYDWSGSENPDEVGWHGETADPDDTYEVGTKKPNELGIYDMTGGAAEWCWDLYNSDYYKSSPQKNPRGPEKNYWPDYSEKEGNVVRVLRGGFWQLHPSYCTVFERSHSDFDVQQFYYGFRICRNAAKE